MMYKGMLITAKINIKGMMNMKKLMIPTIGSSVPAKIRYRMKIAVAIRLVMRMKIFMSQS